MAPESAVKSISKKAKKSTQKVTEETAPAVAKLADVDSLSPSTSKAAKGMKRKTRNATEVTVEEKGGAEAEEEEPVKIRKKAKKDKVESRIESDHVLPAINKLAKSKKQGMEMEKTAKKSKVKAPSMSPEPVEEEVEEEEIQVDEEGSDDEDNHLHGFSTDDDDSSDDEVMDLDPSAFDVAKLPTIAKDDEVVKRKLEKAKRQPTEDRGVLFLGRIPHGFYEDQLKAYFSQFGTVTRLRLSRNKRTGQSKHYGFLEFDSSSVSKIVAETMDNYLLMGHILRCKQIPRDEVHPELWVGANRKWRSVPKDRLARVEHNKPRTEDEQKRAAKRLMRRQRDRQRKLKEAGIKYNFEAVSYKKN